MKTTLTIQKSIDSEYRVAVMVNGQFQEAPSYYADSLEDAKGTRLCMAREFTKKHGVIPTLTKTIQRNLEF